MRLIDADALKEIIKIYDYPLRNNLNSIDNGMYTLGIMQAIDSMPTIEEDRPKGRWIDSNIDFTKWLKELKQLRELREPKEPIGDLHSVPHYRCPACKGGIKMYENSLTYPFCHHCGQAIDWSETE